MSILQPIARRSNVKKSFVGCRSAPIRRAGPQYNVGVSGRPAHTPLPLYYYIGQTVWESHFASSYWVNLFGTRWPRVPLESHSSPTRVEFPQQLLGQSISGENFPSPIRVPLESHSSPILRQLLGQFIRNAMISVVLWPSGKSESASRRSLVSFLVFSLLFFFFSLFFSFSLFSFLFFSFLFLFPLSLLFSSRASSQNNFLFQGGCKLVLLERYFFSSKCLLFPSF